jgi:hypothetical protein
VVGLLFSHFRVKNEHYFILLKIFIFHVSLGYISPTPFEIEQKFFSNGWNLTKRRFFSNSKRQYGNVYVNGLFLSTRKVLTILEGFWNSSIPSLFNGMPEPRVS